jgi:hypothetical protein
MHIDVFNGDADGICALIQLRLANPKSSQLISGVKRDICLLSKVRADSSDTVTVLDVSMKVNQAFLLPLLEKGTSIFYADHHQSGEIPTHSNLTALIDTDTDICTSLIINRYLQNQFAEWAIVGAFGDNLDASAMALASQFHFSEMALQQLKTLGICLNYNGYGESVDQLHFNPCELYQKLGAYDSPIEFMTDNSTMNQQLISGYEDDMEKARQFVPEHESDKTLLYILPNANWAKRVSGSFGNELATKNPAKAHAILTKKENGNYQVSVRSPLNEKTGADELCSQFPTGGGRKAAAGINDLEKESLDDFLRLYLKNYNSH